MNLTERDGQGEDGPDKVTEPQRAVLPDILEDDRGHDGGVEPEADLGQRVLEPVGPEDARLLLGVGLEGRLPELDAADEVLELAEVDPALEVGGEDLHDEPAGLDRGAALDVV